VAAGESLQPYRLELQAEYSTPLGSGGRQSASLGLKLFTVHMQGLSKEQNGVTWHKPKSQTEVGMPGFWHTWGWTRLTSTH
jgi:hypothetical protein